MEILIVAKTRMTGPFCCVGALDLQTNRSLRLLQPNGQNMPDSLPVEVGEVWEMDYVPRQNPRPPHVEDVLLTSFDYLRRQPNMSLFLKPRIQAWEGGFELLFEGKIRLTSNHRGYVSEKSGIPGRSTGFWLADADLVHDRSSGKSRYIYSNGWGIRDLPYVGLDKSVDCIPAGTLLRVSLARWWRSEDTPDMEERCYLQLSGWYEE
jgi:hypothetical protein